MTPTDDGAADQPIGADHFDSYFRPSDQGAAPSPIPPPSAVPAHVTEQPTPEPEPVAEDVPMPVEKSDESPVDTGRLFRSQGVAGHDETVLALTSDHGGKLRTLDRSAAASVAAATPVVTVIPDAALSLDEGDTKTPAREAQPWVYTKDTSMDESARHRRSRGIGLRAPFVYVIVMGVTVIVGFINAWLSSGSLGWPTGVALVVSSIFAAVTVRRQDDFHAMIVPPLAFALAALTAPQVFAGPTVSSLLDRGVVAFFSLANNWMFIIGATLASVVIVLIRRYKP